MAGGEGDAKGRLRGGQGRDNGSATGLQRPAKKAARDAKMFQRRLKGGHGNPNGGVKILEGF